MRGVERCCTRTRWGGRGDGQPPKLTAATQGFLVSLFRWSPTLLGSAILGALSRVGRASLTGSRPMCSTL